MHVCPECGRASMAAGLCPTHGIPFADAREDPLLGQMVGSYRLARLLGQGGMGQVYLGVQPSIDSRVAIKVLAPDGSRNAALVERFFAEARAVNVIRHDNTARKQRTAAVDRGAGLG